MTVQGELSGKEPDEVLAAAGAAGIEAAFAALVRRHGGVVHSLLERLVGHHHDAWDLAQDVWIKVHRSLASYDAQRPFRPWLMRIALNHGRDALRRGAARIPLAEGPPPAPLLGPDPSLALVERAAIEHALDRVPALFREAVVLVDVAGLSYHEAAVALGCAVGTVKSRVGRGRSEFRRHYDRGTGVSRAGARAEESARSRRSQPGAPGRADGPGRGLEGTVELSGGG